MRQYHQALGNTMGSLVEMGLYQQSGKAFEPWPCAKLFFLYYPLLYQGPTDTWLRARVGKPGMKFSWKILEKRLLSLVAHFLVRLFTCFQIHPMVVLSGFQPSTVAWVEVRKNQISSYRCKNCCSMVHGESQVC